MLNPPPLLVGVQGCFDTAIKRYDYPGKACSSY